MLELLYASGLRISELAGAKLENLESRSKGIVRVTGKGKQDAARAGGPQGLCRARRITSPRNGRDSLGDGAGAKFFFPSAAAA